MFCCLTLDIVAPSHLVIMVDIRCDLEKKVQTIVHVLDLLFLGLFSIQFGSLGLFSIHFGPLFLTKKKN